MLGERERERELVNACMHCFTNTRTCMHDNMRMCVLRVTELSTELSQETERRGVCARACVCVGVTCDVASVSRQSCK